MKLPLTIITLLPALIIFTPTVTGQTCSCKAPDESCEVRVTCRHGCTAVCSTNNSCYAACGNFEVDLLHARVTLKINKGDSKQIAASLTRQTGRKIEFVPNKMDERFSIDLKNGPLWNALEFLSKRGHVAVNGTDFEKFQEIRRTMLKGGKVSVNFNNVPVKDVVEKLSFLSGLPFHVESGDAESLLSISLQGVTLSEIVARISAQTGVKIEQTKRRASTK